MLPEFYAISIRTTRYVIPHGYGCGKDVQQGFLPERHEYKLRLKVSMEFENVQAHDHGYEYAHALPLKKSIQVPFGKRSL